MSDLQRIESALAFVPADDRDTWLRMGMAVKSELGEDGFSTWDSWSQGVDSYKASDACNVWKSIRPDGGVTIGTLFHEAKATGWQDDNTYQRPSPEEIADRQRKAAERQAREQEAIQKDREQAAAWAKAIWEKATEARPDHPYLDRKRVSPTETLREIGADVAASILGYAPKAKDELLTGRLLVIPVKQGNGLANVELIDGQGRKAALKGRGTKAGGIWATDSLQSDLGQGQTMLVGEGVATVLSAKAATGYLGIAALSSSNLVKAAEAVRKHCPRAQIIILADLVKTSGDPDPNAMSAAKAIGAMLAVPDFGPSREPGQTDFNDLAITLGEDAVQRAIAGAAKTDGATKSEYTNAATTAPEPLRAPLPPGEAYPVDALGDVLGDAARALHEVVKAPMALCCQSVLAAASLAAQAHFDVQLPWGQRKPLSLFLLTVGESGERKSAVDDVVLGAAKAQEKEAMAAYQEDMERHEADMAAWSKAAEAARTAATQGKKGTATAEQIRDAVAAVGDKPVAPIAPLRFVTEPTVEGIYKLLAISQPSVALFSDEGGLLIGGHALNGDNFLKTITRWSKMWDGAPFDRVRAGDGVGILYGRRMALHQLAQGDVMVKLLSDRLANGQGLLARCLVAWPESIIGTRQTKAFEWAGDRREVKRMFAVLSGLLESAPRTSEKNPQELDPLALPLSDEAVHLALQASNQFETLMATGNDLSELRDRTAKALENACRIAGVLAAIEGGMGTSEITTDHLARALTLVQWYLAEALRIRGAAAVPQSVQDAEALSNWLQERGMRQFRTRDVLNAGPAQLRNKARLMAAIDQLVEAGYITACPAGTEIDGVKARKAWEVHHHVV